MQGNMLLDLVIRPPRGSYPNDAGMTLTHTYGGLSCQQDNFVIKNNKNEDLHCSITTLANQEPGTRRPCVIYMHGNAGNKHEGLSMAANILPLGIDLFTFDFSGCGNSDGQWVTLGWKECDDLKAVLDYLQNRQKTSKVAFWGRSMGGATALRFDHTSSSLPVACMVVDSSFCKFIDVATQLVS